MDEPITRNEQYLQGAVNAAQGNEVGSLPEPITREEKYLKGLVDAVESYVTEPLDVQLSYDGDSGHFVASENLGSIVQALSNNRRVTVTFTHPLYSNWTYKFDLTSFGQGDDGEGNTMYFAAVQLVDPNTGSLNVLSCTNDETGDEWILDTYSL